MRTESRMRRIDYPLSTAESRETSGVSEYWTGVMGRWDWGAFRSIIFNGRPSRDFAQRYLRATGMARDGNFQAFWYSSHPQNTMYHEFECLRTMWKWAITHGDPLSRYYNHTCLWHLVENFSSYNPIIFHYFYATNLHDLNIAWNKKGEKFNTMRETQYAWHKRGNQVIGWSQLASFVVMSKDDHGRNRWNDFLES